MRGKLITLFGLALIGMLLIVGCAHCPEVSEDILSVALPDEGQFTAGIIYIDDVDTSLNLAEGFGVNRHVKFDGVYGGYTATVPVTLVNGHDKNRQLILSVRISDKVAVGYEPLPFEYLDWVVITEPTVSLLAGEIYQVPVTLSVPKEVKPGGYWYEVRILVEELSQTATAPITMPVAVEQKWFITMAE